MSSTGRVADRQEDDLYETPKWTTRAVIPHVLPKSGTFAGLRILEPSAGHGAIVRELIAHGAEPHMVTAVEPDAERAEALRSFGVNVFPISLESFAATMGDPFDLIIGNPPFLFAEPHIRLCAGMLAEGGTMAMLTRLAFLAESQCRAPFRKAHPHDRVELVKRPSFTAEMLPRLSTADLAAMAKPIAKKGQPERMETIAEVRGRLMRTDSCAYAWGLFGAGRGGYFVTHEEA